jgi:hypothetical protein
MKSIARMLLSSTEEVIWHRGEDYANRGRVQIIKYDDRQVKAHVTGTEVYRVSIKIDSNRIRQGCNCPYSRGICKHLVATAIVWDELRGIKRPTKTEIKTNALSGASHNWNEIDLLFADPLEADLNHVRVLVNYTSFPSKRRSQHAILPHCPKITMDERMPLKMKEVEKAFKEMERWSRRVAYDHYFCAGEMAAAFCELLDVIASRADSSSPEEMIDIMALCVEWYYKTFLSIIDGSDGIWIFPVARIGRNVDSLKSKYPTHGEWEEFDEIVCDAAIGWETEEVDSDFIASWKDSSL